jgi:hypothetical protein
VNIIKLFFLILITIFFSGCLDTKPSVKKVQTPHWIKTTPKDNKKFTYGVGISKTKEGALKEALNDVISKLGVKVKSSFVNKEIVDGYYSRSISSSNIEATVSKIRVTNYKVEKSQRLSNSEYAVLIIVDNKKFFNTLKKDINLLKKSIEKSLERSATLDAINRYKIKKEISKDCDILLSNTLVAYQLDNSFDKNIYFNFVSDVKDDYYSEAKSLRFFVMGDDRSENFAKVINKGLLNKNFTIVDDRELKSVKVYLKITDNISSKKDIVKIKIDIKVLDGQKLVGNNTVVLKERFNSSKSKIYDLAYVHFEQEMKELGLENILGIGTNN